MKRWQLATLGILLLCLALVLVVVVQRINDASARGSLSAKATIYCVEYRSLNNFTNEFDCGNWGRVNVDHPYIEQCADVRGEEFYDCMIENSIYPPGHYP